VDEVEVAVKKATITADESSLTVKVRTLLLVQDIEPVPLVTTPSAVSTPACAGLQNQAFVKAGSFKVETGGTTITNTGTTSITSKGATLTVDGDTTVTTTVRSVLSWRE
jgi:hypothetical protein